MYHDMMHIFLFLHKLLWLNIDHSMVENQPQNKAGRLNLGFRTGYRMLPAIACG